MKYFLLFLFASPCFRVHKITRFKVPMEFVSFAADCQYKLFNVACGERNGPVALKSQN